jgi:WD40 repeat protein
MFSQPRAITLAMAINASVSNYQTSARILDFLLAVHSKESVKIINSFLLTSFLMVTLAMPRTTHAEYQGLRLASVASIPGAKRKNSENVAAEISRFDVAAAVMSLSFSPTTGDLAVATFANPHIEIWKWDRGPRLVRTLINPDGTGIDTRADGMVYSPDGAMLAVTHGISSVSTGRSIIRIFDPTSGAIVTDIFEPQGGGANSGVVFSLDGSLLIRSYNRAERFLGDQIIVQRAGTWEPLWGLRLIPLYPTSISLSRSGEMLAVAGITLGPGIINRGQVIIVDLVRRQVLRTIDNVFANNVQIERVAWSSDGVHLAVGGRVGGNAEQSAVIIFDTTSGEATAHETAKEAVVTALRYTSDGKYLIESGIDHSVMIWNGTHTTLLQQIKDQDCYALAVSHDDKYLAIGDGSHVTIWKLI